MSFAIAAHHCELFHRKAVSFSLKKNLGAFPQNQTAAENWTGDFKSFLPVQVSTLSEIELSWAEKKERSDVTAFSLMAKIFEKRSLKKMLSMAGLQVFQPPQVYK